MEATIVSQDALSKPLMSAFDKAMRAIFSSVGLWSKSSMAVTGVVSKVMIIFDPSGRRAKCQCSIT